MADRIEQLQAMLNEAPEDVFLHYSLAMEYASQQRFDEAVTELHACMTLDGGYLPAYVEAGKCLRSAGRLDEAREVFAAGMELAAMQGERHMRDHIQQQLDGLAPQP